MTKSDRSPQELLEQGRRVLDPVLTRHGFHFQPPAEAGSMVFASGRYARDERGLELHVRQALGLVIYQVGAYRLTHETYMRYLGVHAEAEFPRFSTDSLDGFQYLARDLERYGDDFLEGLGVQFRTFAIENLRNPDRFRGIRGLPRKKDR